MRTKTLVIVALAFAADGHVPPAPDCRGAVVSELPVGGGCESRGLSRIPAVEGRPRDGEGLGGRCGAILCEFDQPKRRPGPGGIFTMQFGHRGRQPQPCLLVVAAAVGRQAGEIVRAARIVGPAGAAARGDERDTRKNGRLER